MISPKVLRCIATFWPTSTLAFSPTRSSMNPPWVDRMTWVSLPTNKPVSRPVRPDRSGDDTMVLEHVHRTLYEQGDHLTVEDARGTNLGGERGSAGGDERVCHESGMG